MKTSDTKTPRTDAYLREQAEAGFHPRVEPEFARSLERALAASQARIEKALSGKPITCQIYGYVISHCGECNLSLEAPDIERAALALAIQFHETYERLAPQFGYETRTETRQFDPTTPNGRLMIAVCRELASTLSPAQPEGWVSVPRNGQDLPPAAHEVLCGQGLDNLSEWDRMAAVSRAVRRWERTLQLIEQSPPPAEGEKPEPLAATYTQDDALLDSLYGSYISGKTGEKKAAAQERPVEMSERTHGTPLPSTTGETSSASQPAPAAPASALPEEPKWVRHMRVATLDSLVPHESEYLAYVDALRQHAAHLQAELAELRGVLATKNQAHVDNYARLIKQRDAAERTVAKLREYARHTKHCMLLDSLDERIECTCGLDKLLSAALAEKERK